MNILVKTFKHTKLVCTHRWYVFKYAVKAGIPYRGLVHDLSKFSPTEFFESVKYYNGDKSPLHVCREHIGYIVEAVCDKIAAGKTYKKDKWTQVEPYNYWTNIEKKAPVTKHPATIEFMDTVLKKIADEGLDIGLNKKFLKETYKNMIEKYEIKR